MANDEVREKMNELTPIGFQVKGGEFSDYVIPMEGGKLYAQAIARVLHANAEHNARGEGYSVTVKSIEFAKQIVQGTPCPIAIVTVRVESPFFGVRENVMTAMLDTNEVSNAIVATHPIETAVTQATGRALAAMGFAFTGNLTSAEEIYEGKRRQENLEQAKNDPLNKLRVVLNQKGKDFDEFLKENDITVEKLAESRSLALRYFNLAQSL